VSNVSFSFVEQTPVREADSLGVSCPCMRSATALTMVSSTLASWKSTTKSEEIADIVERRGAAPHTPAVLTHCWRLPTSTKGDGSGQGSRKRRVARLGQSNKRLEHSLVKASTPLSSTIPKKPASNARAPIEVIEGPRLMAHEYRWRTVGARQDVFCAG